MKKIEKALIKFQTLNSSDGLSVVEAHTKKQFVYLAADQTYVVRSGGQLKEVFWSGQGWMCYIFVRKIPTGGILIGP